MSASTTLLTDANTLAAGTPTATSAANAINPANAIEDLQGELRECAVVVREYKNRLTRLKAVLDAGDPLYTTVSNDLLTLT